MASSHLFATDALGVQRATARDVAKRPPPGFVLKQDVKKQDDQAITDTLPSGGGRQQRGRRRGRRQGRGRQLAPQDLGLMFGQGRERSHSDGYESSTMSTTPPSGSMASDMSSHLSPSGSTLVASASGFDSSGYYGHVEQHGDSWYDGWDDTDDVGEDWDYSLFNNRRSTYNRVKYENARGIKW